tara:strand:- start:369 stop:569 length:201 start_codon:yes stop_codon:yes gene_type:complete
MNIERIVSSSERGFVERSVDYIESCMNTHHAQVAHRLARPPPRPLARLRRLRRLRRLHPPAPPAPS